MKIYFTKGVFQFWKLADSTITTSFDLGLTKKTLTAEKIQKIVADIEKNLEGEIIKDNYIYLFKGKEIFKLALFHEGHFYKLSMMSGFREPVLEIDGLRMQVIKEFESANEYATMIVNYLGIKRGTCLEFCSGIGYITSVLSERCEKVVTIEKSKAVLALAKLNPYSKGLFAKNVKRINGDAFEKIQKITEKFDFVIHDPPRYSHAPQLYSIEFYKMIKERLNPGGRFFHYTGTLTSRGDIHNNIKNTLEEIGFKNVKRIEKLQGFIASL